MDLAKDVEPKWSQVLEQVQQMLDNPPEITGEALKAWHDLGPLLISEIKKNTACFDEFEEDKHCYDE